VDEALAEPAEVLPEYTYRYIAGQPQSV